MLEAKCRGIDPDLFFPQSGGGPQQKAAQAVCKECPVKMECLEYALDHGEEFGIWGGLTSKARKRLLREHLRPRRCRHCPTIFYIKHSQSGTYYCSRRCLMDAKNERTRLPENRPGIPKL